MQMLEKDFACFHAGKTDKIPCRKKREYRLALCLSVILPELGTLQTRWTPTPSGTAKWIAAVTRSWKKAYPFNCAICELASWIAQLA